MNILGQYVGPWAYLLGAKLRNCNKKKGSREGMNGNLIVTLCGLAVIQR
mgnify:CR=1 FL=1